MVSFYIRDKKRKCTSISCSVNYRGQKRIYFTIENTKISPKDWSNGRMVTGRGRVDNGRIQDKLDDLKRRITKFYDEFIDSIQRYPSETELFEFLKTNKAAKDFLPKEEKVKAVDFFQSIIERRRVGKELTKGKKFSEESITLYNSFLKSLKGFQDYKSRNHYYLEEFKSKKLIEEYEIYLTTELDMRINTIQNRMKTLKSFLQIAYSDGLLPFNPFKKHNIVLYSEESFSVVFTREELLQLELLDLSGNPFWDKIRDQYLLYLWSGVRKGDLKNLLKVINPDSKTYLFKCNKTDELSEIPAFETLKKVAAKYSYQFSEPVHDTIVLREIKKICMLIPSMHVPVENSYIKGGETKREIKSKYDMIVIHTARRTLATILIEYGLLYEQVMKITGHKKITTLQKYVKSNLDVDKILSVAKKIRGGAESEG